MITYNSDGTIDIVCSPAFAEAFDNAIKEECKKYVTNLDKDVTVTLLQ